MESPNFNTFFGAVEQKRLRKLSTKKMCQIFQTAKSIQVLGNADHRMPYTFSQVFSDLGTPLSIILIGACLLLVLNAGTKQRKERTIGEPS